MRRRWVPIASIAALGLGAWALRRSGVVGGDPWDPLTLRVWVQQAGAWGPLLYVAVATLVPLFAPYPVGLTWVAGVLFGWALGGALVALSGLGSSLVGYAAGRYLGGGLWRGSRWRQRLADRVPLRLQYALGGLLSAGAGQAPGWGSVAFLRVTVPWDLVSYWAGARSLPLRPYFLGTAATLLPVSFGHTYLANAVAEGDARQLTLGLVLLLSIVWGPLWYLQSRPAEGQTLGR